MHFEVLVEDQSGEELLRGILPKLINESHTYRIISYKGIGFLPKNLKASDDPKLKSLLNNLPKMLKAYSKTQNNYSMCVFVICDLDTKCLRKFRNQLLKVADSIDSQLKVRFCIAVEEMEAWLLGDISAVTKAYPDSKMRILSNYENDKICGTWELLADAIYRGGSKALKKHSYSVIGKEKRLWAENIAPHINVDNNQSPSFNYFRLKIREILSPDE